MRSRVPERMIQTFGYEGLLENGHATLDAVIFEAFPGDSARITAQSFFQSVKGRDGMIQSGMESGVNEGYEQLDELLVKMQE